MLLALQPLLNNGWSYVAQAYSRTAGDSVSLSDAAARQLLTAKTAADSTAIPTQTAARVASTARSTSDSLAIPSDTAARLNAALSRSASDSSVISPIGSASPSRVSARTAADSIIPADYPVLTPSAYVGGVVRNSDGTPYLLGATVHLIRDSDGLRCQVQTSSTVDGSYFFVRDVADPYTYTVRAFTSRNLLANSDYEAALVSDDMGGYYSGTWVTTSSLAQSNRQSLAVTTHSTINTDGYYHRAPFGISVPAGTWLAHAAYVWAPAGQPMVLSSRSFLSSDNSYYSEGAGLVAFTGTGAWQRVLGSAYQLPVAVRPGVQVTVANKVTGVTYYVDAVQLEIVSNSAAQVGPYPGYEDITRSGLTPIQQA